MRFPIAAGASVVLFSGVAHATFTAAGDEFHIADANAYAPRVAADAAGAFVVVWQTFDPTNDWEVRGRRFDEDGDSLGDELAVNTYTTGLQEAPTVAATDDGRFLVAWFGSGADDQNGSFARVFGADGVPKADEFRLHDATSTISEHGPAAAATQNDFLVAWIELTRIAGLRLDANGTAMGNFEAPAEDADRVAVDTGTDEEFVVVWSTSEYTSPHIGAYGSSGHVQGSTFGADGASTGDFQANSGREDPTGYDFIVDGTEHLAVAADARGNFVVGHDSRVPSYVYNVDEQVEGYALGSRVERFEDGLAQGSELLGFDAVDPTVDDVAMSPGGNVVVVGTRPDADQTGIYAHVRDCNGNAVGNDTFQVNMHTTGNDRRAAVAVDENGAVVVVWQTHREGSDGYAIVGRRFALSNVCALCGDADADGRIDASDALNALRTSVGSGTCAPARCDADASQSITAGDALRILQAAVNGGSPALGCTGSST